MMAYFKFLQMHGVCIHCLNSKHLMNN